MLDIAPIKFARFTAFAFAAMRPQAINNLVKWEARNREMEIAVK